MKTQLTIKNFRVFDENGVSVAIDRRPRHQPSPDCKKRQVENRKTLDAIHFWAAPQNFQRQSVRHLSGIT